MHKIIKNNISIYNKTVVIYCAVAHLPLQETLISRFSTRLEQYFKMQRDLFQWQHGSLKSLDYQSYVTPFVFNIGDFAIAQASCQTFAKLRRNLKFDNSNWKNRRGFNHQQTSMIAVCGGGYIFFDASGNLPERLQDDLTEMLAASAPVVFYGVGVNRLLNSESLAPTPIAKRDEILLHQLLQRVSYISVRDKYSQQLLSKYTEKPVRLIGDPAFFLSENGRTLDCKSQISNRITPVIGINFPFHGPAAMKRIKDHLLEYILMLKKIQEITQCQFVYMVHFDAERIIIKLIESSGIKMSVISGSPDELCLGYASLNINIGGMLHSCILAASVGTPSVALAYDIKHTGFFELFGLERYCLPASPFNKENFVSSVLNALKEEAALRATIHQVRSNLEKYANAFVEDCLRLI